MAPLDAKRFRQRVARPADGVFLFHPRALERLIQADLAERMPGPAVPRIFYYLMPRRRFLTELEAENPEALSVIEGLDVPAYVILLPMPPEQTQRERDTADLLRGYWQRRFEGEVARAWQIGRDTHRDEDRYGAAALRALIGAPGFAEVRGVLERDEQVPQGLDDEVIARHFVGMVVRLRYFAPGARGFYYPGVEDWGAVDDWLVAGGVELPSPRDERQPRLLVKSRPAIAFGSSVTEVLLPTGLPYGRSDPDRASLHEAPGGCSEALAEAALAEACAPASTEAMPSPALTSDGGMPLAGRNDDLAADVARYRAVLIPGLAGADPPRWRPLTLMAQSLLGTLAPMLGVLLWIESRLNRRGVLGKGWDYWQEVRLMLLGRAVARAVRAERAERFAVALDALAATERWAARIDGGPGGTCAKTVAEPLALRTRELVERFAATLADTWNLGESVRCALAALIGRLVAERDGAARAAACTLLMELERILIEGRASYYRLHPIAWLLTLGRRRLRQSLVFQGPLKALRALNTANNQLEQLPWPGAELDRGAAPLHALSDRIAERLDNQLRPHLEQVLTAAGFVPQDHRERIAGYKLREELLDVIKRRWHLRFTDLRDVIARNILRLPDVTAREMLLGDRLARFDRVAAQALPGVYQRGEIYVKGLQWLGAPLFGSDYGRRVLRFGILPFGGAFVGLEAIDYLAGLVTAHRVHLHLSDLPTVLAVGLLANAVVHTETGRHWALALGKGLIDWLRFLLFQWPTHLLRWPPVAQLLAKPLAQALVRYVLQPLFLGLLTLLPFLLVGQLLFESFDPLSSSLLLAWPFALGTLLRNTPLGRRMVDDLVTSIGVFWRRFNQAVLLGFLRELGLIFKEVTRAFLQRLHQIRELLTHRSGDGLLLSLVKALITPVWRFLESLTQFYVTVLVEPQVNPIKHFPTVTVGHKLMLPFLPAITTTMAEALAPVMPKVIAYPFVGLSIALLPGLFGFLVWELKENWRLYAANHSGRREPAVVGSHGETLRSLLRRGFHSGTVPKAFDRLRRVITRQVLQGATAPQELRRARHRLLEIERALYLFIERELAVALREQRSVPECRFLSTELDSPRVATTKVEFRLVLHAESPDGPVPITLWLMVYLEGSDLVCDQVITGVLPEGGACRALIDSAVELFVHRCGARVGSVTRLEVSGGL